MSTQSSITEVAVTRRILRTTDRTGRLWFFAGDQIASLLPLNDGGTRINLRGGRWLLHRLSPAVIASKIQAA